MHISTPATKCARVGLLRKRSAPRGRSRTGHGNDSRPQNGLSANACPFVDLGKCNCIIVTASIVHDKKKKSRQPNAVSGRGRGALDGSVKRRPVGSGDVFSCHRLMKFPPSTVVVVVVRTGYCVKLFSSPAKK